MRLSFLLLIFLVWQFPSTGQSNLPSDKEGVINAIQNEKPFDTLSALLLIHENFGPDLVKRVGKRVEQYLADLRLNRLRNKSHKKIAKKVFKETHDEFFVYYDPFASFDQIFQDGSYNCVSATALYALIFEKMGVDYEIRATTNHAYAILDPHGDRITIEATNPIDGWKDVSASIKRSYVKSLREMKMINPDNFAGMSDEEIYDVVVAEPSDQAVPFHALIGYQFHNRGIELIAQDNYKDAIGLLEAAQSLFPNSSTKWTLELSYAHQLDVMARKETSPFKELDLMQKYRALLDSVSEDIIENYTVWSCYNLTHLLVEKSYPDSARMLYDEIISPKNPWADDVDDEIHECYHMAVAEYHYFKGNSEKTIKPIIIALYYNPRDVQLNYRASASISSSINYSMDTLHTYNAIKEACEFVDCDSSFQQQLMVAYYLASAYTYFSQNQHELGFNFLGRFNDLLTDSPGLEYSSELLGDAYGEAWSSHNRTRDYEQALEVVNEGLSIDPDNAELKRKKKITELHFEEYGRQ